MLECCFSPAADKVKYVYSTIINLCCVGFIAYGIGSGYAALPGHPAVLYILFVAVIILLAYLEGLQVAILALQYSGSEQYRHLPRAYASHKLSKGREGMNVQRFLIGRQFFVVFVVFLCAQLTTFKTMPQWSFRALFIFVIETGLPGALVVLAFGQLIPQLVAATHPVTFMNLPGTWSVIQLCLVFETCGVTHFSWLTVALVKKLCKLDAIETVEPPVEGRAPVHDLEDGSDGSTTKQVEDKGLLALERAEARVSEHDNFLTLQKMNLKSTEMMDDTMVSALAQGAQQGLESDLMQEAPLEISTRWLKDDSVRHRFAAWGVTESTNKLPAPPQIVQHLMRAGEPVPRYLLPPHHPKHIPPHIVAYEMIKRNEILTQLARVQNETLSQLTGAPRLDFEPGKGGGDKGGKGKGNDSQLAAALERW